MQVTVSLLQVHCDFDGGSVFEYNCFHLSKVIYSKLTVTGIHF